MEKDIDALIEDLQRKASAKNFILQSLQMSLDRGKFSKIDSEYLSAILNDDLSQDFKLRIIPCLKPTVCQELSMKTPYIINLQSSLGLTHNIELFETCESIQTKSKKLSDDIKLLLRMQEQSVELRNRFIETMVQKCTLVNYRTSTVFRKANDFGKKLKTIIYPDEFAVMRLEALKNILLGEIEELRLEIEREKSKFESYEKIKDPEFHRMVDSYRNITKDIKRLNNIC